MSTASPPTLAAILLVATLASPGAAQADEDAAASFREGIRRFEAQDYAGARTSFQQAYRISPDARVLANIADCFAHEGHDADAVRTYRRFLTEAGEQVPAAARRLVERRLSELRPQVCDLRVVAEPAGATIRVDDVDVGTAPMADAWAVDAGEHTVEVQFAGHRSVRRTVQARGGGDLEVAITLDPEAPARADGPPVTPPPAPGPAPAPPRDAPTPLGRGPLVWAGVAVTAVLVIGGSVTGLLALSQQSEYEDPATSPARRRALYADRDTLPLVTDVLFDAAIVTGLTTVALLLFAGPHADAPAGAEQATVSPRWLRDGGVACDLRLAF